MDYDDCQESLADIPERMPDTFDYRELGVVSPIKDQGECMTCYIFAGVGAIESAYMLNKNVTGVRFSEKDVFNCLAKFGYQEDPCDSGAVEYVFKVGEEHGLIPEDKGDVYELDIVHHEKTAVVSIVWFIF